MKGKRLLLPAALLGLGIIWGTLHYCSKRERPVPEYVFTYAENQTQDYPTTLGARYFAELVEERSGGRIRITVQAEGILGTENEVLKQMQYGGIDFARVSLSNLAEQLPKLNVLQMPYLYTDADHMWRVLDGEIGEQLLETTKSAGLIGLSWYDAGARNFYNSVRAVETLEDMRGLKIRVQDSDVMVDMVRALGAIAVPLDYNQVYSGLERGMCDGAENNWPSYETMLHYEVAEYYTVDEHTRVPELQLCAEHTWKKLSEADRMLIKECAKESALYERELWAKREEVSRQLALDNGVSEVVLSKEEKERFGQKMGTLYQKYCREYMDIINEIIEEGKNIS